MNMYPIYLKYTISLLFIFSKTFFCFSEFQKIIFLDFPKGWQWEGQNRLLKQLIFVSGCFGWIYLFSTCLLFEVQKSDFTIHRISIFHKMFSKK